jgi:hypothetical protein
VWSKCNQLQPNSEKQVCKLLKMVARDGIEPPTPAFSGQRSAALILLTHLAFTLTTTLIPARLLEQ